MSTIIVYDFRPAIPFKVEVLESSADTDGRYVKMRIWQKVNETGIPIHIHPTQEETYTVTKGLLEVYYEKVWHLLNIDKSITIAKGKPHTFRTTDACDAEFINIHTPALHFEEYIAGLYKLVINGKIKNPMNFSSRIYLSMLWIKHKEDLIAVKPPYFVMSALAGLGKILRYKID